MPAPGSSLLTARCVLCVLAACAGSAEGETFDFHGVAVPREFSLATHYVFYASSAASVEYRLLPLQKSDAAVELPEGYPSVEVSLLPFDSFWHLVDPHHFCATVDDVRYNRAKRSCRLLLRNSGGDLAEQGVSVQGTPHAGGRGPTAAVSFPIARSGKYILAVTNCGNFSKARMSGTVSVRSAHGYLPANELGTMRLFGWLSLAYLVVLLAWSAGLARRLSALDAVQRGIGAIAAVCLVEAAASWLEYQVWNATGVRRDLVTCVSLSSHTLKFILSWRLVLLAAPGAGVAPEDPGTSTQVVFSVVTAVFLVQNGMWRLIVSSRYSLALERVLVFGVPGTLIFAGMYVWTFKALSDRIASLDRQKHEVLARMFRTARLVLVASALLSALVTALQFVDIWKGLTADRWERQWITLQGAPQFAFMSVLIAMMLVWRPSEGSWKYDYSVQVDEEDGAEGAGTGGAKDADPEARARRSVVAPEPIGAGDVESDEGGVLL